jgi:hypothetical protein
MLKLSTSFYGSLSNTEIYEYGQLNRFLTQKGANFLYRSRSASKLLGNKPEDQIEQEPNINGIQGND